MTDASRALVAARWTHADLARGVGLYPKTIRRWELGASRPREAQWVKVLAFYGAHAPAIARTLAAAVGRQPPANTQTVDAPHLANQVIADAADALDLAPKRVREMLRAVRVAAEAAGVPVDRVVLAAERE